MIRKFIVTSALTLGGTVALAATAMAQSVDINFSGTVQGRCSFGTPTPGTLVTTGGSVGPAPELSSGFPGGSPGQVTVTCNQPASLVVSTPIQTGGPSVSAATGAVVISPTGSTGSGAPVPGPVPSPSSTPLPLPPAAGAIPLSVHMGVRSGSASPLQPGNYNFKVTLTVIP